MTISPEKLQVLLEVVQRAPVSLAERIICQEVAEELIRLVEGQQAGETAAAAAQEPRP